MPSFSFATTRSFRATTVTATNTASSPLLTFHQTTIRRSFSSQQRGRRKSNSKDSTTNALSNEKLIQELIKKFPQASGPDDIEVRLVIDEGPEMPSTVQVCSLSQAITISLDRMADLLGTALQSDPPVIRVTQLSKLAYQKEQAASKQKAASSKAKQKKTFRFRAGIDTYDLERKIAEMKSCLERGVECEYTVFSKARLMRANADVGMELVDRIQELLADCSVLKRKPQPNEEGSHIRVQLEPKN